MEPHDHLIQQKFRLCPEIVELNQTLFFFEGDISARMVEVVMIAFPFLPRKLTRDVVCPGIPMGTLNVTD